MVSSQLEAFLETMAGECDEKALRAIKASDIFYSVSKDITVINTDSGSQAGIEFIRMYYTHSLLQGGVSKLGNPVFYFIARKFRCYKTLRVCVCL